MRVLWWKCSFADFEKNWDFCTYVSVKHSIHNYNEHKHFFTILDTSCVCRLFDNSAIDLPLLFQLYQDAYQQPKEKANREAPGAHNLPKSNPYQITKRIQFRWEKERSCLWELNRKRLAIDQQCHHKPTYIWILPSLINETLNHSRVCWKQDLKQNLYHYTWGRRSCVWL